MSRLGRERIHKTFFEFIAGQVLAPAGKFVFADRRYVTLGQLGESQYPAFFYTEAGEAYDRSTLYVPAKVSLYVHLTIQTADGADPNTITATAQNELADDLEDAVTASALKTAQTTLGGLVQEAWVNGRQAATTASRSARYSEYVMAVELVLPRMR